MFSIGVTDGARRRRGAVRSGVDRFGPAPRADSMEPMPPVEAEQLFREGREAMKRADYALACPSFERSLALDPALGTLLNLAVCEEKRGRLGQALARYRQFVELAAEATNGAPWSRSS